MANKKNVIILTSGISGSSVLASFIAGAGYFIGDKTFKKKQYDTNENLELVELNKEIMSESGFNIDYTMHFSSRGVSNIDSLKSTRLDKKCKSFLKILKNKQPWLWKDPRLWLTIRYWKRFLNFKECKFIFLTRDSLQVWVSAALKRQIQTYSYSKNYNGGINKSLLSFFKENNLEYLHIHFEDLLLRPEKNIEKLNGYLGTDLTISDLKKVYNDPLYKKRKNLFDFIKAVLIYFKNYPQRYK